MNVALPQLPIWVYVVVAVLFAVVLGRTLRGADLKIDRLWIMPTLIVVLTAVALSQRPPNTLPLVALSASAALAGAALGWWRGQFTLVKVNAETHALTSYSSPVGVLVLIAVVAVRMVFRVWILEHASAFNLTVADVTDALLLFAVGLVCAERIELAIRAGKALNEARDERVRSMFAPVQPNTKQRSGPVPNIPRSVLRPPPPKAPRRGR